MGAREESGRRFRCGLYGGCFNPLHQGHVRCMLTAANRCERLIIAISHGARRGEIDIRQRYRWVYEAVKHLPHVELLVLTDDAPDKAAYTGENWLADAQRIRDYAREPIDAVFCGSDYGPDSWWRRCYPGAEVIVLPRDGCSSSEIRRSPIACWDMLPAFVRPYYARRVLIIGGESTGKSTLTISLARHYNTCWLEEVGREIAARSGTDQWMIPQDFTDILLTHKARETALLQQANRVLFEDTDCLTTLFYISFLDGPEKAPNAALADAIAALNRFDLILCLQPDVPFIQDGDRSEVIGADRAGYSAQLTALYAARGLKVIPISGDYQARYQQAVRYVDALLAGA